MTRLRTLCAIIFILAGLSVLPAATAASAPGHPTFQIPCRNLHARWLVTSQPSLKISIQRDGWYRMAGSDIAAAGLRVSDPRYLRMFAGDRQIPIAVTGSTAATFSRSGDVQFYGTGIDDPTTGTHVYWLIAGSSVGMRIGRDATPPGSAAGAPVSFTDTLTVRKHLSYDPWIETASGDNWLGQSVYSSPTTISLAPPDPDPAGAPATLGVALQDVSVDSHSVNVSLDGTQLGAVSLLPSGHAAASYSLPPSSLQPSGDSLRLTPAGDTDVSLVDYVSVTYSRLYRAESDALRFTASPGQTVRVSGFTGPGVRVIDVTQPDSVKELTPSVTANVSSYDVTVRAPGTGGTHTLYAFGPTTVSAPQVTLRHPTSLQSPWNTADLLIVSYGPFESALQPLVALRRNQGMRVMVADVQDVFDEFGYGEHGPQAIKAFLAYTQKYWLVAPKYVLLAGHASNDPRNYSGAGNTDLVPTELLYTSIMQTASDSWLVDFNGDGYPDITIGRLPARTAQQMTAMVSRIVGWSSKNETQTALLVAGRTRSDDGRNFTTENDALKSLFPLSIPAQALDYGSTDATTLHGRIMAGIDAGPLFVNYLGHGNVNLWGDSLLQDTDVTSLTNGGRLPIFVMMTCLNGYFIDPLLPSLAEDLLVSPGGGAVGAWTSTGETTPDDQIVLNRALYSTLFAHPSLTVGQAIQQATRQAHDPDVLRTWVFLGDPTMKVLR